MTPQQRRASIRSRRPISDMIEEVIALSHLELYWPLVAHAVLPPFVKVWFARRWGM
jgi:hypothetical protein